MPYADPEKQKAAQAKWYREKYAKDHSFRAMQSVRKGEYLQTEEGKAKNRATQARHRARKRPTSENP